MQRVRQGEQRLQVSEIDIHNGRLSDRGKCFIGRNRNERAILGCGRYSMFDVLPQSVIGHHRSDPDGTVQSPRRVRIAIDMDEVMADALGEHLRRYNIRYGASLTAADLQGLHLEDYVPVAHREAAEAMIDASFFAGLAVLPDCQTVVQELAERYEVFIVSAAMDVPCSFDAKYRWLRRHFPFIPPTQIVFCGDKSVVDADYLIDDRARHFAQFKGRPLLFSAPHNAAETRYQRVSSWKDVRAVFADL
jgi:5'-nucleotidase